MIRRLPLIPTLVVFAAALLMVRLGFWQLHRLHEKEALLAVYAANATKPPLPLAALFPISDDALFRRTSATCLSIAGWKAEAGHSADGSTGWRHIAACRTGAEGPGILADMGLSQTAAPPAWSGGPIAGRLTWAPTNLPLVAQLFQKSPAPTPLIVSDTAAPGLRPTAPPDPATIPNNHLSYAVQWFLFAGVAVTIYLIAAVRRGRSVAPPAPPR